jgi:putative ABC transport system substrate-binding protein
MNKRVVALAFVVLAVIGSAAILKWRARQADIVIGVNQLVTHPLLDAVYRGLTDGLKEGGLGPGDGVRVILKNANGDQNLAYQINRQFVDQGVDMIVPIATAPAQSACKVTSQIPIVFAAITDPVEAGVAESLERPGANKTGSSDRWPYEQQIGLMRRLVPAAKKAGIVLNPGESNTIASMKLFGRHW